MVGKCVWFCGVRRAYHVTDSELVSQLHAPRLRWTMSSTRAVCKGQHAPRER
jgi:hypothetical protein